MPQICLLDLYGCFTVYGDVQAMVMAPASVQPDKQICSMPSLAAIRLTVYICRVALHGHHMHMAAGLGMLGYLTCVRLLSTVSKTGAIMEKSVPGELSSWLDLRRRARSQHVRRMQKGERRKALSTNADTFGLSMGRSPFPEAGSAMQIHRVESVFNDGLPEWVGWQRRAGLIPHPVPQHGCALLHHARHAIRLLHLIARPARRLLGTAKVALHRRIPSLMWLHVALGKPHSGLASVRTHPRHTIRLLLPIGCPASSDVLLQYRGTSLYV